MFLITTCYGGRNRKCAEAFAKKRLSLTEDDDERTTMNHDELWSTIEKDLLDGQKLQGTLTSKEVQSVLSSRNMVSEFPLMSTIYDISFNGKKVHDIVHGIVVNYPVQKSFL